MHRSKLLPLMFLLSSLCVAQTPSLKIKARSYSELNAEERSLVGQWCRLDYEGARLNADGWKRFSPLTSLKNAPDYQTIYVISRYQMTPSERPSMQASVTYTVIGRYEPGVGYTPEPDTRYVTFDFAEKDSNLQISQVDQAQPNVSKPAIIAWLKAQLAAATSKADKLTIQTALNKIDPPPPPPPEPSSSSKEVK